MIFSKSQSYIVVNFWLLAPSPGSPAPVFKAHSCEEREISRSHYQLGHSGKLIDHLGWDFHVLADTVR